MEWTGPVVVLVTVSNLAEADKISSILLEGRKAACVNVVPKVMSRYWWQGKIDSSEEALLLIKTQPPSCPKSLSWSKRTTAIPSPKSSLCLSLTVAMNIFHGSTPKSGGNAPGLEIPPRSYSIISR